MLKPYDPSGKKKKEIVAKQLGVLVLSQGISQNQSASIFQNISFVLNPFADIILLT